MKKPRILLSGLGGSLFPYLNDRLSEAYEPYYVDSDASLAAVYPGYRFHPAPPVTHPAYPAFISELIRTHGIGAYAPLIDEEIEVAHALARSLPGLALISPRLEFCRLSMDKAALMEALERAGLSRIPTWRADGFRWSGREVFLKPNSGRGSRGIRRITSEAQLEAYFHLEGYSRPEVIVQEYVTGTEYTVGVLSNARDQVLCVSPKRVLRKRGITLQAVTERHPFIEELALKVDAAFKPRGPYNIQMFLTPAGEPKIFEINPRFSTTSIMSWAGGVDEISLWLENRERDFSGPYLAPRPGIHLHRRWENVFHGPA